MRPRDAMLRYSHFCTIVKIAAKCKITRQDTPPVHKTRYATTVHSPFRLSSSVFLISCCTDRRMPAGRLLLLRNLALECNICRQCYTCFAWSSGTGALLHDCQV